MPFAFCPDNGPPRLIRFVTLESNIVATLDRAKNLLLVDRAKLNRLNELDQREVFKTLSPMVTIE
jgi:hypothetical protein